MKSHKNERKVHIKITVESFRFYVYEISLLISLSYFNDAIYLAIDIVYSLIFIIQIIFDLSSDGVKLTFF